MKKETGRDLTRFQESLKEKTAYQTEADAQRAADFLSLADGAAVAVFPGFADVHVHLREPGFSYKETIAAGSAAGARGGYTCLCAMPNLSPVADSPAHLAEEQALIDHDAVIAVRPYGAITVGEKGKEIAPLEEMASQAVAFSDDGRGVQDEGLMREAMQRIAALHKVLAAHCEVEALLCGGYIHDGEYAAAHGHKGISSESEWKEVERDIRLADETGCPFHVCHISTKESVELIRDAKKSGVDITCETAPHYLLLDERALRENGAFKMNPPIRAAADRAALIRGAVDGTIDMIATDHAPHAPAEKARGLAGSAFGIVGLETAFPLLYTYLVRPGILPPARLLAMLTDAPRARFGADACSSADCPRTETAGAMSARASFTVFDLKDSYTVDPAMFLSKGRATPFAGWQVQGRCLATFYDGKLVYEAKKYHG